MQRLLSTLLCGCFAPEEEALVLSQRELRSIVEQTSDVKIKKEVEKIKRGVVDIAKKGHLSAIIHPDDTLTKYQYERLLEVLAKDLPEVKIQRCHPDNNNNMYRDITISWEKPEAEASGVASASASADSEAAPDTEPVNERIDK